MNASIGASFDVSAIPLELRKPLDVMVVDADPLRRAGAVAELSSLAIPVRQAESGGDALASVSSSTAVVVVEAMLPDVHGFTVCKRLKSGPSQPMVILCSEHCSETWVGADPRKRAQESGVDSILLRPTHEPELCNEVASLMRRHCSAQEARARAAAYQQLLSIAAHDLLTPLHSILMSAHLLKKNIPDSRQSLATGIEQSARRAARLVEDLLDLSRADRGEAMPVRRRRMSLGALAHAVVAEIGRARPDRNVQLELRDDTCGHWDADRLSQVITNLINNALTHGDPSSHVRVEIAGEGDWVRLTVQNSGAPIPVELLPDLFMPFQRGSADGLPQNLGLGLFIVERIVQAHEGNVAVTSSPAEGTAFTVRLPRRAEGALDRDPASAPTSVEGAVTVL